VVTGTSDSQGVSSYYDSALPAYVDQYVLYLALAEARPAAPGKINPWACAKLGMCQPIRDPSAGTIATVLLTAAGALAGPEFGFASDAISSGTVYSTAKHRMWGNPVLRRIRFR